MAWAPPPWTASGGGGRRRGGGGGSDRAGGGRKAWRVAAPGGAGGRGRAAIAAGVWCPAGVGTADGGGGGVRGVRRRWFGDRRPVLHGGVATGERLRVVSAGVARASGGMVACATTPGAGARRQPRPWLDTAATAAASRRHGDGGTRLRVLLVSTPVGPLGSGAGGGVELTLRGLVDGLGRLGHHVEVVAPAGSSLCGERLTLHQVAGALQDGAQHASRGQPTTMPADPVLGAMWDAAADLVAGADVARRPNFDVVVNLAYDWLPLYLTRHFHVPVVHLISMGSTSDAMDAAIGEVAARTPGRLVAMSRAQADTYPDPAAFRIVGGGVVMEQYDVVDRADGGGCLGFVGRISPEKGLEDVAELSARIGRPVRVWGVMQDRAYWARVRAAHPGARLDYRGFLATDQLQVELGRCAALVMTSKWVEAFGNVAVEALATGVPVITYDRGGPAEIVVDGETGFVVPADSVDALVAAVGRIGEIDRAACRRRAEVEYSATTMAQRWVACFDNVIGDPRRHDLSPPTRNGSAGGAHVGVSPSEP